MYIHVYIYICIIFTCLHDPSFLTNNPYLAVNLADFQQDFPPKDSWLATQTCQDKGPKCQQWLWGYNVTTRLQGWYLKIIFKKHSSHQQDWKTRFPFGWFEKNWGQVWNWPNGRWIFTPPSPQEVSPPNELRSLCNSCHRLLLSHARCPDKKFGQGRFG